MIVARDFVLLHVPKTGGTWATRVVLLPHAPPEWEVREVPPKHGGIDAIPGEHRGKPVFAFVRNPWSWYVSWWAFHLRIWRDREYADRTGDGLAAGEHGLEKRDRWAALAQGPKGPEGFRAALPVLVEHESATSKLVEVVGDGAGVTILRYEELFQGLERIASTCGEPPPALREALGSPAIWASGADHWAGYYTPESLDLVARADAGLIARYGYRP